MTATLGRLRLAFEVWASRYGVLPLALLFAAAALTAWTMLRMQSLQHQASLLEGRVTALEAQARSQARSAKPEAAPTYVWSSVLEPQAARQGDVKLMISSAKAHRLTTIEADYRRNADRSGLLEGQQIVIPVSGAYPDLRRWLEHLLKTMPHASIDRLSIQRESMADKAVQARVQVTLWQRVNGVDAVPQPSGGTAR